MKMFQYFSNRSHQKKSVDWREAYMGEAYMEGRIGGGGEKFPRMEER